MKAESEARIIFSETVRPPIWLLAFIFFLLGSVALSIWAAFDNPAGLITFVLSLVALPIINNALLLRIVVTSTELQVGRAHIEREYLGQAVALDVEAMRLTRGRDADPYAYLALRFWQPRGVKVEVKDKRDETPYWLISSKKAKGLVEALTPQG